MVVGVLRVRAVVDVRIDDTALDLVPVQSGVPCLLVLYLIINTLTILHRRERFLPHQTKGGDAGHCLESAPYGREGVLGQG